MSTMIHAIKAGVALSLAIMLSACATTLGRDFSEEYVETIKSGETTKADVLGKLGRPALRKGTKDEEVWTYAYYSGPGVWGWMTASSGEDAQYGMGKQKRLIVVFSGDVVKSASFTREIPEPH